MKDKDAFWMGLMAFVAVVFSLGAIVYAFIQMSTPAYIARAEAERVEHETVSAKWYVSHMVFAQHEQTKICFSFSRQTTGTNIEISIPTAVPCTPEVLDFIAKHK